MSLCINYNTYPMMEPTHLNLDICFLFIVAVLIIMMFSLHLQESLKKLQI